MRPLKREDRTVLQYLLGYPPLLLLDEDWALIPSFAFFISFSFSFLNETSLCISSWLQTHYVAQVSLELIAILLPQPLQCQGYVMCLHVWLSFTFRFLHEPSRGDASVGKVLALHA